jgi:hypothetical protein
MLAAAAVAGVGMFGAPAPAHAGGTKIVVAAPGVFVAVGDRDHKRYRDYDYKDRYRDDYKYRDYKDRDYKYRDYDRGDRYRDYDRKKFKHKDRGYHRGHYKRFDRDCDRRGRRYRY